MPDTCLRDCIGGALCLVVCEGGAEEAVIEILLEDDALIFDRGSMVYGELAKKRTAREVESEYLHVEYNRRVVILRILDSRKDTFKLGAVYQGRYEVFNIYTRPEIEMLLICAENRYRDYWKKKSKISPSTFCKEELFPRQRIKQKVFWRTYFQDSKQLERAIWEYHRVKSSKKEYDLSDLLRTTPSSPTAGRRSWGM